MVFEKEFEVRWADLDPNFHVRHSVYADYCATVRLACLESLGFGYGKMAKHQVGPILFKETITYIKEIRPGGSIKVDFKIGGLSESGHKFKIDHQIFRQDGELAAHLEVEGAWFDLTQRKVTTPPDDLLAVMNKVEKTAKFKEL